MEIAVNHDHVLGAGPVRLAGHGTRDLDVLDLTHEDDILAGLDVRTDTNDSSAYRRRRSPVVTNRGVGSSVAPVEIAGTPGPECLVERSALDVLDGLLARPRKAIGAQLGGRLSVHGLLDPRLLLALEERMVLERIAIEIAIDRHVVVEARILALEREMLPDRLCEAGLGVDWKDVVLIHAWEPPEADRVYRIACGRLTAQGTRRM